MTNDSMSPAARAVYDAVLEICPAPADEIAAAVLRAAVAQVVPETELLMNARGTRSWYRAIRQAEIRAELLAIAAELEGSNG